MKFRVTVEAPANIAFVKYWGAKSLERAQPYHPSISMTLRNCWSRTTVEYSPQHSGDEIWLAPPEGGLQRPGEEFTRRIQGHLDRLRDITGRRGSFRVATRNSFPAAAGLASSASGLAALTLGVIHALGLELPAEELSSLARLSGSGSAARSVLGGYVEWPAGPADSDCFAVSLAAADHWDLRDVIALVQTGPKSVSSLEGHRRAETSPHFARRRGAVRDRLRAVRNAIQDRDLSQLGPVLEEEAIELHLIAMSSRPPIFYWTPATVRILEAVRRMRQHGVEAWSTMDAGPNVHVICSPEAEPTVAEELARLEGVDSVIHDGVGSGPRRLEDSLLPD